ncbi:LysR family transcriptional regulator [Paracidovorax konjaci]|uniref:DNA-binding transcriptional regulator, LysR family n=1 Tax=Paracidovorax konjaci TaxID=32040 RepID=A0A1I1WLW4_9BURK|nr:LysR family transcriptional regulator [Paracidovorax konjaci]SFD96165.1 DNA-binding transcriptional regulator, LysR family [Paracidovorax konjaci]
MDRLTAMQVYADVASTGSFTASAERLQMSRAMVTRYVAEMERWLGARLLQRTTRRVTLTDAGEQCLRRCLQMIDIAREVVDETSPADGMLRGQLRLTCSMSFGVAQLAAALGDFLARHPHLKVDLDVSEGNLNLVASRIDLAIRISDDPDPALIARPLAVCDSVLVASPAYLARAGRPAHPSELADHACLGHATFGRSRWRFTEDAETVEVPVTTRFTANDAVLLLAAAESGAGVALQPTYLARPRIAAGALEALLPRWHPPELTVYALYPSRKHLPVAVRALLDFLVERFAGVRW